jgi:ubiquinone/menaquinone biosynthesis C-methylase UbiE
MKKLDQETWSYNWHFARLTSFGSVMPDNYDGAFLEFWNRQLVGDFDHVVDLACGNGALVWIFNEILNSGGRKTKIVGVDFANISPFKALNRNKDDYPEVRFIGKTPIEKLPFEDNSIDLAASQYGVEYSNLEESIPEIARVLTSSGKMSFILHDRSGVVVQNGTKAVADYKVILNESNIHKLILELAKVTAGNDFQAEKLRSSVPYQTLIKKIELEKAPFTALLKKNSDIRPVFSYVSKLNHAYKEAHKSSFKREHPLDALVADAWDGFRINIEMLEDLEAASLDQHAQERLCSLIEGQGFAIEESRPLEYKKNENWGVTLVAKRVP